VKFVGVAGRVALTVAFVAVGLSPLKAQYASAARTDSPKSGDKKEWAQFKYAQPSIYRLGIEERNGYNIGNTREMVVQLVERLYAQAKDIPYSDYAGFSDFLRRAFSNMNRLGATNISFAFFEGVMAGDYDCDRGCFLGAQIAAMKGYHVSFVFTRDHVMLKLDGKYYANVAGLFDPLTKEAIEAEYGPVCFETDDLKIASFVVYNNLAMKKHKMGDDAVAVALADTAIALAPEVARLYYNRAVFKTGLGNIKGAEKDLNAGLALDPNDDLLFYQFYEVSMAKKDYSAALGYLKTARVLAPNDAVYKDKMSELWKSHPEIFRN